MERATGKYTKSVFAKKQNVNDERTEKKKKAAKIKISTEFRKIR